MDFYKVYEEQVRPELVKDELPKEDKLFDVDEVEEKDDVTEDINNIKEESLTRDDIITMIQETVKGLQKEE